MSTLIWPEERAGTPKTAACFSSEGPNLYMDFHGDPSRAGVTVLSDGNHHMALEQALASFVTLHPDVGEVFYTTTPPRVMNEIARAGAIRIGNLQITIKPDIFIGPPGVLQRLMDDQLMTAHRPFMRSASNVLLVQKGNPKKIYQVDDLLRDEVRLFLSNPVSEAVSHKVYRACLNDLAAQHKLELTFLVHPPGEPDPNKLIYGKYIHHREAPQAIADGCADVAMVYYHLALRYKRIFPDLFDWVWASGTSDTGICEYSRLYCGMSAQVNDWGKILYQHLLSAEVAAIYRHHGLEPLANK